MADPPGVPNLAIDLASFPNHVKLEGFIDLDSIPDMPSPINMEDEDNDTYIQEIPGVMTFGIKRACPNVIQTAPPKLRAITSRTKNNDLLQLPKTLDFTTADRPVRSPVTSAGATSVKEGGKTDRPVRSVVTSAGDSSVKDDGKTTKKEQKTTDLVQVPNRESFCFYKSLQEEVSAQKLHFTNHANAYKEDIAEKQGLIVKLKREVSDLKHSVLELTTEKEELTSRHDREKEELTSRHDREIEDVKCSLREVTVEKEGLVIRHDREIEDVKSSLRELSTRKEGLIQRCTREIADLKDSMLEINAEQEGHTMRHNREIEDLRTSFSIEKALIENRHRQQMAAYRSEILTVVLQQTTQNQEAK